MNEILISSDPFLLCYSDYSLLKKIIFFSTNKVNTEQKLNRTKNLYQPYSTGNIVYNTFVSMYIIVLCVLTRFHRHL